MFAILYGGTIAQCRAVDFPDHLMVQAERAFEELREVIPGLSDDPEDIMPVQPGFRSFMPGP